MFMQYLADDGQLNTRPIVQRCHVKGSKFRQLLKMHLFAEDCVELWLLLLAHFINVLTYLLTNLLKSAVQFRQTAELWRSILIDSRTVWSITSFSSEMPADLAKSRYVAATGCSHYYYTELYNRTYHRWSVTDHALAILHLVNDSTCVDSHITIIITVKIISWTAITPSHQCVLLFNRYDGYTPSSSSVTANLFNTAYKPG